MPMAICQAFCCAVGEILDVDGNGNAAFEQDCKARLVLVSVFHMAEFRSVGICRLENHRIALGAR
jgi:hypothetical protein